MAVPASPPDVTASPLGRVADEPANHGARHGTDRTAHQGTRDSAGSNTQGRPALCGCDLWCGQCTDQDESSQDFAHA